jgi:CubicO group peptidase (beta-lactamase class C family)
MRSNHEVFGRYSNAEFRPELLAPLDEVPLQFMPPNSGALGEYGWSGAYHTTYWVDPAEDLLVVHMTQLIPAGGVDDFARVRALVYQALLD